MGAIWIMKQSDFIKNMQDLAKDINSPNLEHSMSAQLLTEILPILEKFKQADSKTFLTVMPPVTATLLLFGCSTTLKTMKSKEIYIQWLQNNFTENFNLQAQSIIQGKNN